MEVSDARARAHRPASPGMRIASTIAAMRDAVATALVAAGVTPNMLTIAGFILTAATGVCLLFGAGHAPPWEAARAPVPTSWWPQAAAAILIAAFACDMLDGAVARIGGRATPFGALLDSTLDRCSDLLLYFACALHFTVDGNLTGTVLALAAATAAVMISYIKARAENLIPRCNVGYWQRGERCGIFLTGVTFGHVPAALWLLGTLPMLTALRRLTCARAQLAGRVAESAPASRRTPWRQPRGSLGYDLCTLVAIGYVIVAPWVLPFFYGGSDPLGSQLRGVIRA